MEKLLWIRVDSGPHMWTARDRRRIWRAARRAAQQARDSGWVEETQTADEAEGEKGRKERRERQNKQCSENTLDIVLHLPNNATTATATAAAPASASMRMQRRQDQVPCSRSAPWCRTSCFPALQAPRVTSCHCEVDQQGSV